MHRSRIRRRATQRCGKPGRGAGAARIIAVAGLLFTVAIAVSCSGASKHRLSEPAQLAVRINTVVADLEERVNARNQEGVIALLTPSLAGNTDLRRGIAQLLSLPGLHATFMVERMWRQDDDAMRVDLQWTLRSKPPSGAALSTGRARLLLVGSDQPRLDRISGENPFATPASIPLTP